MMPTKETLMTQTGFAA